MIDVYHLQKWHPDAGEFRLWSLLARTDISVSMVGRIMALNKQVYDDIPHVHTKDAPKLPQPHPYKATAPHQFWFIDGRMMDFALDGVKWWSLIMLEGYRVPCSLVPGASGSQLGGLDGPLHGVSAPVAPPRP